MTLIYPGSFDPVTIGHMDIARRAAKFADRIIIAVLENPNKQTLFSAAERVALLKEAFGTDGFGTDGLGTDGLGTDKFRLDAKIEIESSDGLLAEFAKQKKADAILRGLRTSEDFERENKYAAGNAALSSVETIFLPATPALTYVSSSIICEAAVHIYKNNLDDSFIAQLLSPPARAALKEKLSQS